MKNGKNILGYEEFIESETNVMVRHYNHNKEYESDGVMIKHWEDETKISREDLMKCPCCGKEVIGNESNYWVGAHVVDKEQNRYITPTCNNCNAKYKESKATEKWFNVKRHHLCQLPQ